jgi:hypothetical protein
VRLGCLREGARCPRVEVEEVNSYKIALIKAYVGRINSETIKYMVVNDRMRIFENCVILYEQYMAVEEEEQYGVEATCISNCILLLVRYLASHPLSSLDICSQEGEKGVVYLLIKKVQHIHKLMLSILNSQQDSIQFELLKDKILFLIDIFSSIAAEDTKAKIVAETAKELSDLR